MSDRSRNIIDYTPEVKQLIEFARQDSAAEIVDRVGLAIQEAIRVLYHSDFFRQLQNQERGFVASLVTGGGGRPIQTMLPHD